MHALADYEGLRPYVTLTHGALADCCLRQPKRRGQWFADITDKKFVVWHGRPAARCTRRSPAVPAKATTSIDGWNNNADRVGAPWLVDRDGTIYKTFDDAGWIPDLGIKGTNGRYDKSSVAIEFALDLDGDRLFAFGMNTPNTIYNGPHISYNWRSFHHFAQLDEAQVDAGIALTPDICTVLAGRP